MSKNKMSVSHFFSVSLCQKKPSDGLKRVETSSAGKCESEKDKLSAVGIIFKNVAHNAFIRSEVVKKITMKENFTSWNVCQNVVFFCFVFLTLPFCEAVRFKKDQSGFLISIFFLPKSVTRWEKAAWCEVLSFSSSGEAASTDLCEFALFVRRLLSTFFIWEVFRGAGGRISLFVPLLTKTAVGVSRKTDIDAAFDWTATF